MSQVIDFGKYSRIHSLLLKPHGFSESTSCCFFQQMKGNLPLSQKELSHWNLGQDNEPNLMNLCLYQNNIIMQHLTAKQTYNYNWCKVTALSCSWFLDHFSTVSMFRDFV